MKRLAPLFALVLLVCAALPSTALAASGTPPREKGLLITPLREYPTGDAGTDIKSTFTVANLTDEPLVVNLSVKQFSVTDYVYNYKFEAPANDWLHLGLTSVNLQPNQSADIHYTIALPKDAVPGGHYYTLFASANLSSQGISNTVQAADLLYLTVKGQLTSVSHLEGSSIGWISFGHNIGYSLQPINTGNVYSFVYVSGQLHGLFVRPPQTSAGHILIPGAVRSLSGSIPSPVLPGVYRATYGYKTDAGWIIQQSHWVLFIPPWFIAFLLAALLFTGRFYPRKQSPAHSEAADEKE